MDDIILIVEGIENKAKKLAALNKQLRERLESLEEEKSEIQAELIRAEQRIAKLEKELTLTETVKSLGEAGSSRAKQKIEELLREIEKTTVLINRQAQ